MEFTVWLDNELNERSWSYNLLAEKCGVSPNAMSKIRKQSMGISLKMALRIAKALTIPEEEVLRRAGLIDRPVHPYQQKIQYLVDLLNGVPEEAFQEVIEFAEFKYKKENGGEG